MDIIIELERATALHSQGKFSEASKIYKGILESHPEHADTLNLQGMVLSATGQYDEALLLFQKAISKNKTRSDFYDNCAEALRKSQDYREAISSYNTALELQPDFV